MQEDRSTKSSREKSSQRQLISIEELAYCSGTSQLIIKQMVQEELIEPALKNRRVYAKLYACMCNWASVSNPWSWSWISSTA